MRAIPRLVLAALPLAGAAGFALAAADDPAPVQGMAEGDHVNLERNLRWILARERAAAARGGGAPKARVGVYADAGAWHVGAHSVVDALEAEGVPCRALDRSRLSPEGLAGLDALVLPGGWAPFQSAGLSDAGVAAVKGFVEGGGRVFGECAGAYLLARETVWEGKSFPYPLALFDGVAEGPVAGLAKWPDRGPLRLSVTPEGKARGLAGVAARDVLYYGGPRFSGGTGTVVLLRYPDGGAALLSRRVGKGEVLVGGSHLERPPPMEGDDASPPPPAAGKWLKAILLP